MSGREFEKKRREEEWEMRSLVYNKREALSPQLVWSWADLPTCCGTKGKHHVVTTWKLGEIDALFVQNLWKMIRHKFSCLQFHCLIEE